MNNDPLVPMVNPKATEFANWVNMMTVKNQFVYNVNGLDITFRYATIKDLVASGFIPTPLLETLVNITVDKATPKSDSEILSQYLSGVQSSKELYDVVVKKCLVEPQELLNFWHFISYEDLENIFNKVISGGEGAANLKSTSQE